MRGKQKQDTEGLEERNDRNAGRTKNTASSRLVACATPFMILLGPDIFKYGASCRCCEGL